MIKLPKQPKPKKGFEIISHKVIESFDPKKLDLWLSEEQKTSWVNGEELLKQQPDNIANACVLDYLLEYQNLIPESWKDKYVYFWGTIYKDSGGNRYVLCLCWRDGRWYWRCSWVGHGWDVGNPSAVLASHLPLDPENSALRALELRIEKLEEFRDKISKP